MKVPRCFFFPPFGANPNPVSKQLHRETFSLVTFLELLGDAGEETDRGEDSPGRDEMGQQQTAGEAGVELDSWERITRAADPRPQEA